MSLSDLIPDARNANRGTDRGRSAVRKSLQDLGAGRSIVLDKHGRIIAGNKTAEQAGKAGISRVIVVRTDGTELVAVQRTDLDLEQDQRAKLLAVADNRTAELGLDWDAEVLKAISEEVDLSGLFDDDELAELEVPGLDGGGAEAARATLAERFGVPPFSVLDARQGYWQERKRAWLSLGIQSELGRGGGNGTPPHPPTVTQNLDGTLNYSGTAGQSKRFDKQRQSPLGGGSTGRKPATCL